MKSLEQITERALHANFDEVQQRYFDKLMSELEEISGGLGFAELEVEARKLPPTSVGERTAIQVLRDYVAKKEQIVEFIENKKVPMKEFSVDLSQYDNVGTPDFIEAEGKVYFKAEKDGKHMVFDENRKQIGAEYDELKHILKVIDGCLYFVAKIGNKKVVVNEQGEHVGGEFDNVDFVFDLEGKNMVFRAENEDGDYIVDKDEKRFFEGYDEIGYPHSENGKMFLMARKGKKWFLVDEDNNRLGGKFDKKGTIHDIGGKIYVCVEKDGKKSVYNSKGEQIGDDYDNLWVKDLDGELIIDVKDGDKMYMVDQTGKKISGDYETVTKPQIVNGKLIFHVEERGKWYIADSAGNKIGQGYDKIRWQPQVIAGKMIFVAEDDGKQFMVDQAGKIIGDKYDKIGYPKEVGGRLFCIATQKNKMFVINHAGKRISDEDYDKVDNLTDIAGKLHFTTRVGIKKGKNMVMREDGKTIGGEHTGVYIPSLVEVNGKVVYMVKSTELGGHDYFINDKGEKIQDDFDSVSGPYVFDKKLYFNVKKDGVRFLVNGKGEKVSEEYGAIFKLDLTEDGQMYIVFEKDGKYERKILTLNT